MAKRKQVTRRRTQFKPGKQQRIKIPQPPFRPVHLHARDVVRTEDIQSTPWWFVEHRRGLNRPLVGANPLEERAIPNSVVRGTLLERIIYKLLVEDFSFVPGTDFTFQSSLDGGRMELGGIVADFLFEYLRIVLNPAGPTHKGYLRAIKDREQSDTLAEMGYRQYLIDQDEILYRPAELYRHLRSIFIGSRGSRGDDLVDEDSELNALRLAEAVYRFERVAHEVMDAL
jgi:hypothetical protein